MGKKAPAAIAAAPAGSQKGEWGCVRLHDPTQSRGDQRPLGRAITTLRERQNHLTPELLAERAKIDLRTLKKIEAGEGDADFNTIVFIVQATGTSMGEFASLHEEFAKEEQNGGSGP